MKKFTYVIQSIKSVSHRILYWLTSPRTTYLISEPFFWVFCLRRIGKKIDLAQVKRVLVIRLDEIGDVVMTTPFLRELRHNLPHAYITLIVNPNVYNLMELCPYINEVLIYDGKVKGRFDQLQRHGRALKLACKYLWHRRFEVAIIPRRDVDYYHASFVAYLSGAPLRVGYSENINARKKLLNAGLDHLLTHALNNITLRHEVEHNLDLIRFLGGMVQENHLEIWLNSEDELFAKKILESQGFNATNPLIALGPGASIPNKMWPLSNFIEIGIFLIREFQAKIIVVGGPGEELLGCEFQTQLGPAVLNVIGRTTLRQTWALLKHCHLYVGNDSGPMHLAAAANIPIIEISHFPTNSSPLNSDSPVRFGPWGVPHIILQPEHPKKPCIDECNFNDAHCIREISVAHVQEAIKIFLTKHEV